MRNIHKTDVLVIGSGGSGLRAAIEAKRSGVDVILASKSPPGFANCTSYALGRFRVAFQSVTPKEHFEATVKGGRFINNEKLVNVLVQEAPKRLLELEKFGVSLRFVPGYCSCDGPSMRRGEGLTQPLKKTVDRMGVKIFDKTTITDILRVGNTVIGAVGVDLLGNVLLFPAKAIVLATGGAGQMYPRNDNPIGTTGDGHAIALRVGVELMDLEFVQFFPLGLAELGLPVYPILLPKGILKNSVGDEFLQKYRIDLAKGLVEARDLLTRAIWQEIREERGDRESVFLDLTQVSEGDFEKTKWFADMGKKLLRDFKFREQLIHIAPLVHYFMGGVKINENCETSMRGLYAVGEVASGIHGANRIGGNALTDTIVFGFRAGWFAAEYAASTEQLSIDEGTIKDKMREVGGLLEKAAIDEGDPTRIKKEIQSIMWEYVGVSRTEAGLREGIEKINELKEETLPKIFAKKKRSLRSAFEASNMIDLALTIAKAARYRTESRGAHHRLDFPNEDPNWLRNVIVSVTKNGEIMLKKRSLVDTNA